MLLLREDNQIKYIKIQANSYEDVENIARINGVKSVDFFQEYSLPLTDYINIDKSKTWRIVMQNVI